MALRSSRIFALPALTAIVIATGCTATATDEAPAEAVGATSQHLYESNGVTLWTQNGNYVPMCWATPGYAREKKIISEAIGRTWVAQANLRVTWNEGCPTTGTDEFVIVQIGRHGEVPLGNGTMGLDHSTDGQTRPTGMGTLSAPSTAPLQLQGTPGMTIWVEDNGTSAQPRMEYVAVHEFGHVLGFAHEQDRPQSEVGVLACRDQLCQGAADFQGCLNGLATDENGTDVTAYDHDSIMNYCNSDGNNHGVLSPLDIAGIKKVYGERSSGRQFGPAGEVPVRGDFDGDGKTDIASYLSSRGGWYFIDSSTHLERGVGWGNPEDLPVPGDYDGDGKTDIAVFRPSQGRWYPIYSSTGATPSTGWGNSGDIPVPGDYDGDHKTDIAVYRPSEGVWYPVYSSNGATPGTQFGAAGDIPVPADYDGDGKTDIAVYRPSVGRWYILNSSSATTRVVGWGNPTDVPVPADYDGDGKTDICVYRPAEGRWYVIYSSNGSSAWTGWGNPSDTPVPADYDGDHKADITVFRPSTETWYTTGAKL